MKRWLTQLAWILAVWFLWPLTCPAPVVYRPGEGLSYEPVGGGKWRRNRAEDQLKVAQESFDAKKYRLSLKAAKRTVKQWPLSDFAPQAQYLVGRSYEARRMDEKAFKEYQKVVEKYPKMESYTEVTRRQHEIADRFLAGQWFKLFGYIPFFSSMDKTARMYETIVKNGPFGELAPQAQLKIGTAREKQRDFTAAVRAYEKAADRYADQKTVASEALYRAGDAYQKQAKTAEYDQSAAGNAIATFNDFMALYPEDPRVKTAQENIASLRTEQARGSFQVARFYEQRRDWRAARVYYNDVVAKDSESPLAAEARRHIEFLNKRVAAQPLRP